MPPRDNNSQTNYTATTFETGEKDNNDAPLQCDYLVIGAGTSGMSFIDTILTENPKATVILVDRNTGPGGHWQHVYPFCRLHQTSCNYGINSLKLGKSLDKKGIERYDVHDRATGAEVVEYYNKACTKFRETGRFRSFFGVEYDFTCSDEKRGVHLIRRRSDKSCFAVKCKKLVRVHNNLQVPSMRKTPTIPVHEGANFVPINDIPSSLKSGKYKNYIVFGCGKTGADAIVHLLQNGIDQSQITWIVSRDVWYFLRDSMEDFWKSSRGFLAPLAKRNSVKDVFLTWEKSGILGRLENKETEKAGEIPKVFKGPTMDLVEFQLMRSIKNVVRMGRATSIQEKTIVLERGNLEYTPEDTLLVDCMADGFVGLELDKFLKTFEPRRINLGPLTIVFNASASAAHIAFLECALEDDTSKNDCCYFVRVPGKELGNIEYIIGAFYLQNKSMEKLMKIPGGNKFIMNSRVNLNAPSHHKGGICRLLWFLFGPERVMANTKKLTKKVESKGFSDLDHCFGVETLGPKKSKTLKKKPRLRSSTTDLLPGIPS